jgi:4-amino-4-deoxy-L-arabinose transferase-like glycosyltransferase
VTQSGPVRPRGQCYNPGVRFVAYLLVVATALSLLIGLGRPAITDSDEAFYAEAGREMVAGGDWLTPHFNYENRFQKPVLFYWVVAVSYTIGGISEAAARTGSALAGLGIVILVLVAGRRWYDEETGLLAAAIVATSYGLGAAARMSLPDLPLAFFITLTTWSAFSALVDRGRPARRAWVVAAVAAGLGFLDKGPIAVIIPGLVVAVPAVLERAWRRVRPLDLVIALAVFLAVALPWYVAMTLTHGTEYLRGFFIGDNLERFATTAFNSHRPPYFYLPVIIGGLLPWSPFLALGGPPLKRLWQQRRSMPRADARAVWWALGPLLLFTVSVGKQPRYILPVLAPLGLLLARWIRLAVTTAPPLSGAQPRLFRWMAGLSGAILVLLGLMVWRAFPLLSAIPTWQITAVVSGLLAAGALVTIVAASPRWQYSPVVIAAVSLVAVAGLRLALFSPRDADPVQQMATAVLAQRTAGERVASYHVFVRNLVYYTHVGQTDLYGQEDLVDFLDTPDRVLCVLRERDLRTLRAEAAKPDGARLAAILPRLRRLGKITYFDPATAKIGAVLWPNLERDQQIAVLITNR